MIRSEEIRIFLFFFFLESFERLNFKVMFHASIFFIEIETISIIEKN